MNVVCSWCKEEGRPAFVREKAPLADARETHGICDRHLRQMGLGPDPLVLRDCESPPRHEARLIHRMSATGVAH